MLKYGARRFVIEIWKDVIGYEGYYQVSDIGNVRSLDRIVPRKGGVGRLIKGKDMSLIKNEDGYLTVKLSKDGVSRRIHVHRVVAEAFIENPDKLEEVNHKDYDRTNNAVDNLDWISHGDNVRYSISGGRHFCTRNLNGPNNPNYGNGMALKKFYQEHPENLLKCGKPGKSNPRATPVRLFDSDKRYVRDFDYFGECAEYLIDKGFVNSTVNSVRDKISKKSRNGKPYANHYFELI